jgi:hypothetical protein
MKTIIDKYLESIDHIQINYWYGKDFNELVKFENLFIFLISYYSSVYSKEEILKRKILVVSKKWENDYFNNI